MTMLALLKLRRWFTGLIVLGGACILLYTYHGLVKCNCDEHKSSSKRFSQEPKSLNLSLMDNVSSFNKLLDFFKLGGQKNRTQTEDNEDNSWIRAVLDRITRSGQEEKEEEEEAMVTAEPQQEQTIASVSEQCRPADRIFFLKTHKTGGSTIANILNRFADKYNLTVVLPKDTTIYNFEWPNKFRFSYTAPLYGLTPNILCNHARYNKRAVNWLFPPEESAYITILRNPVDQYESTFNFMQFGQILGYRGKKNPMRLFLNSKTTIQSLRRKMRMNSALLLIKNPMFFDLGLDFKYHTDPAAVDNAVKDIDQSFKVVLLMEYFDESMVLLKRTLCWSLEDVLHFKLNERRNKSKAVTLSAGDKVKIRQWNQADVKLYDHFNKTFWDKINAQGEDFHNELRLFRAMNRQIADNCLADGDYVEEAYVGTYVRGFSVKPNIEKDLKELCSKMMRKELAYVDYWRKKINHRLFSLEEPDEHLF